jgi:hypothetical protein
VAAAFSALTRQNSSSATVSHASVTVAARAGEFFWSAESQRGAGYFFILRMQSLTISSAPSRPAAPVIVLTAQVCVVPNAHGLKTTMSRISPPAAASHSR